MKCAEILETMPDLAAGLDVMTPAVDEHLRSCTTCAEKLADTRKTMALLDEWQAPEPSPYFDTRLQARLREEIAKPAVGWLNWVRRPALAISLSILMAVGVVLVSRKASVVTPNTTPEVIAASPGTAVGDLQALDKNDDLYADFDVLDDLQVQKDVTANP